MIAERLAQLRECTNRWKEKRPDVEPFEIGAIICNENRDSKPESTEIQVTDEGTDMSSIDHNSTYQKQIAIAEQRKKLVQSAERWRERVRADPDLEYLAANNRLKRDLGIKSERSKTVAIDVCKGLDRFYTSNFNVSPPSKILEINTDQLDDVVCHSAPKLAIPLRAPPRGRRRPLSCNRQQFSSPKVFSAPVTPINYRIRCSDESDDDQTSTSGIAVSARRGLQSKLDYSDVKLKKCEKKSQYPDLMLVRIKGEKNVDVRLVVPKYSSVHAYAVFVLITPEKLFVFHGKYSNVLERSKASVIVHSICDKNGELGCQAKNFEFVHEGHGVAEFWRLLGCSDSSDAPSENHVPNEILNLCEPFENIAQQLNYVYEIGESFDLQRISHSEMPRCSMLHEKKNLIFDFGSEIYVWVGRRADRNGMQQAIIYAEELRAKALTINADRVRAVLGHEMTTERSKLCIVVRLAQGLNDILFRNKFLDWKHDMKSCGTPKRWRTSRMKSDVSFACDEDSAHWLANSLASKAPEEPVVVLEDVEIGHITKNIITEGLRYFVLEGEKDLRELDDQWLFNDSACYVVKWEYRIERIGVRKLDGTNREHETGRPRCAYFYWLGSNTSKTDQGLCALALRDFDRDRYPHQRVTEGSEPPIFLHLIAGRMTVMGANSRIFLVYGSEIPTEAHMVEQAEPVIYRSHAVYIKVTDHITVIRGADSNFQSKQAAENLAQIIRTNFKNFPSLDGSQEIEYVDLNNFNGAQVLKADNWQQPPRMFRLNEKDGHELSSTKIRNSSPFSFSQSDLRDTMLVDQGNRLWLWSENAISTFALRVATHYWADRNGEQLAIRKGSEPDAFKALYPQWIDLGDEIDENNANNENLQCHKPMQIDELLKLHTTTWPLAKVIARDLPSGADLKMLERYLNDSDFEYVFGMTRTEFYSLAGWKQIELRKKHNLF